MPMLWPRSVNGGAVHSSPFPACRLLLGQALVRERGHRLRCPGATWRWVLGLSGPGSRTPGWEAVANGHVSIPGPRGMRGLKQE